jgi:MFS family permease
MLTVFVDMMGFLIVLPLLPFYAERLGADPTKIGALVAVFALAQLAMAPLWGRLSDRYGRRPMIIAGLAISAISYILFEGASTVWLLFASRIVQGAGAGTNGVVQAYLSDTVPPERRSQALGWLTAAASAGVMLGPAIASLAATIGTVGPGYLAAGLCLFNLLFAWRNLPEPKVDRKPHAQKSSGLGPTRRAFLDVVRHPRGRISSLIWIYAIGMMAFMAMNGILALYLGRSFGVDVTTIGWFYTYVGGLSLIMRSLVLGPAVKRFGEVRLLRIGALTIGAGMLMLPLATSIWQLAVAAAFVPIGTAFLFPASTSLLSQRAAAGETGSILGVQQSVGGIARMVGPLWAGVVFQHIGIRGPFWISAGLMLFAFFFAAVVRDEGVVDEVPPAVLPDTAA